MTTNRFIFITGVLIFLIPFVAFPRIWEEGFLILAGLVLMLLASLNIWQRSIVKRLKFHSDKLNGNQNDKEEANTETRGEA